MPGVPVRLLSRNHHLGALAGTHASAGAFLLKGRYPAGAPAHLGTGALGTGGRDSRAGAAPLLRACGEGGRPVIKEKALLHLVLAESRRLAEEGPPELRARLDELSD